MPVTHTNRRGQAYFLHAGSTKTGRPRFWSSTKAEDDLVEAVPDSYEVCENPDCQVSLRRIVPQVVAPFEVAAVEDGLERHAPGQDCIEDVQQEHIIVYHAERVTHDPKDLGLGIRPVPARFRNCMKVMRFTLTDEKSRSFRVQRCCFKGSIDRWIDFYLAGGEG